jgi:hypothetical protein
MTSSNWFFPSQVVSTQHRGAESALVSLCRHFKEGLFEALPHLWAHITEPLDAPPTLPDNPAVHMERGGTCAGFSHTGT